MTAEASPRIRIDKWLWHARFFKSRTLAGKFCAGGGMRVNDQLITKAHVQVGPGDVLTFAKGNLIKVIKIAALGTRRGPAPEAQGLYEDLSPPPPPKKERPFQPAKPGAREPGAGRPTKAQRRAIDKLRGD
ncbi:RNA-binding S4 domain-containing protein [Magnetovibrio sp. PR-2]|uniref:RNA-binding S4 domain-containing protein n=1 Tax=Magnetovibrio sp. PR-2 TaxID=3120356 RepID=UPI002FCE3A0B